MTLISAVSFSTSSGRPPLANISIDSCRFFTPERRMLTISLSSRGRRLSMMAFLISERESRMAATATRSPDFIAALSPSSSWSLRLTDNVSYLRFFLRAASAFFLRRTLGFS